MSTLILPPDSTVQDLDDELIFQNVLLSTLDPGADDYDARREELEENIQELQRRLDALLAHGPGSSEQPTSHRVAHPLGMDGASDDMELPGLDASSGVSRDRPLPGENNAGSTTQLVGGSKRAYPQGLTHDAHEPALKRLTPDPSHASKPPSPSQAFDLAERPVTSATERVHKRHREAEERLRRQREDEAMARSLQHQMSSDHYRSTPGPSSSRPHVQTTIGTSGHFQRPAPPPPVKAESATQSFPYGFQTPSMARYDTDSSRTPVHSFHQPTPVKSEYRRSGAHSAIPGGSSQSFGNNTNMIDLTASDSEDDCSEIVPPGSATGSRSSVLPPSRNLYNGYQPMPGSYPGSEFSIPSNYNPIHTAQGVAGGYTKPAGSGEALAGQPTRALAELQRSLGTGTPQPLRYGYSGGTPQTDFSDYGSRTRHVKAIGSNTPLPFNRHGPPGYNSHVQLKNTSSGSRAASSAYGWPSLLAGNGTNQQPIDLDFDDLTNGAFDDPWAGRRSGMYAGKEDLYQNRYEAIANYDPQQTREEINALLNNIRPDEDMPAHLRVQTPPGMAVRLHKYQELGLTWLKNCEEGSNQGGILADDMGLGKTIQMLSLIVSNRSDDPSCRQTLVVAPVALMRQWKSEILTKVKPGPHALKVFVHHGQKKKPSFAALQQYDVVLTTFGSLAAELKKLEVFKLRQHHDQNARPTPKEKCVFLAPEAKWYRVILDEAQCIKNKNTQTAKAARMLNARYRFCVTGTPMMNNADELYSLIAFLRMRPYSSWEKFRLDFSVPLLKGTTEMKEQAMQKFQAVCKAIMLRRTKKSTFEGKPILILPERRTEIDHPVFSADETNFYNSVEGKTQLQFNKYLKAGTVGRSYSEILVLLLRLRQACCHPHLLKDFGVSASADISPALMVDLAEQLDKKVVSRIRQKDGTFECPVCYDAVVNPAIFIPCGHDTCSDCFARIADPAMALAAGNETGGSQAKCPECRGVVDGKRITDYLSFKKVHQREKLTADELAAEDDEDGESDDDSDSDSDDGEDQQGDLKDFIVPDDAVESEDEVDSDAEDIKNKADDDVKNEADDVKKEAADEEEADEGVAGPSTKPIKSERKLKKGKGKRKPKETLAELKKSAGRSAKAKKAYLRRLRRNWISSAKIEKTMELLQHIMDETDEKVLVFSQWTSLLDLLEVPIDRAQWRYRRYDGSMNAQARGDAVEDFSGARQNVRIMLLSLKAGNAGLNLNTASQVILLDPFWNPYIEEQAIDRAHRIGQTREVQVHRILVQNTVEDRIIELQEKKRALISTALDEKAAQGIARLGVRELAYLFGVTATPNQRIDYVPQHARA
nr:putative atp-dependent helicase c23e6.02 [Quercus suber]